MCVCVGACILATNKEASPIVTTGGHNMIISSLWEIGVRNLIVSTYAKIHPNSLPLHLIRGIVISLLLHTTTSESPFGGWVPKFGLTEQTFTDHLLCAIGGNGKPLQDSCLGNPRSLVACSPWGLKELDMT